MTFRQPRQALFPPPDPDAAKKMLEESAAQPQRQADAEEGRDVLEEMRDLRDAAARDRAATARDLDEIRTLRSLVAQDRAAAARDRSFVETTTSPAADEGTERENAPRTRASGPYQRPAEVNGDYDWELEAGWQPTPDGKGGWEYVRLCPPHNRQREPPVQAKRPPGVKYGTSWWNQMTVSSVAAPVKSKTKAPCIHSGPCGGVLTCDYKNRCAAVMANGQE